MNLRSELHNPLYTVHLEMCVKTVEIKMGLNMKNSGFLMRSATDSQKTAYEDDVDDFATSRMVML